MSHDIASADCVQCLPGQQCKRIFFRELNSSISHKAEKISPDTTDTQSQRWACFPRVRQGNVLKFCMPLLSLRKWGEGHLNHRSVLFKYCILFLYIYILLLICCQLVEKCHFIFFFCTKPKFINIWYSISGICKQV